MFIYNFYKFIINLLVFTLDVNKKDKPIKLAYPYNRLINLKTSFNLEHNKYYSTVITLTDSSEKLVKDDDYNNEGLAGDPPPPIHHLGPGPEMDISIIVKKV